MSARRWCEQCQAERESWHVHGDPLERLTREELLQLARDFTRTVAPSADFAEWNPHAGPLC